jgi:GNAT superfamily N-acetyltransferase
MPDEGRGPVGRRLPDRFEEWLHLPVPLESTHPRFDIRRAPPAEFDAIYGLVDDAFGVRRPRALYDWLYRRNPYGRARCWVVIERASGRLIGSTASWPWPMARGAEPIEGVLAGDWVVAPDWQRQGIAALRGKVRALHPWQDTITALSWPNEKSLAQGRKYDRSVELLGPVPRGVLPLKSAALLRARQWPAPLRSVLGTAGDIALQAWRTLILRTRGGEDIKEVRRFDATFDAVTQRCMAWHGFWPPHDAEFLNWRYLDHPTAQYAAFALVTSAGPAGYCVVRTEAEAAWLMEFAAPAAPRHLANALLLSAIAVARDAGCTCLKFSAPPGWRHWRLFRTAGFLPILSEVFFWPAGPPEVMQLNQWQWVPGDMDAL